MKFIDALECLYKSKTSDKEFIDPFWLYCRLSDLCGASYEDKRKVLLFYNVNKKVNLVKAVIEKDKNILSRHNEVADLLSQNSFERLINLVRGVIFPQLKEVEKPKPQPMPKPQKKAGVKVVVTRAEQESEQETRTPLNTSYKTNSNTDFIIGLSVAGGILLTITLLIIFACVFDWPWVFWQWFIGIVGGAVLSMIVGIIISTFVVENVAEYYACAPIVLAICVAVNFILYLIFRGDYRIIYCCFSVIALFAEIGFSFSVFDDGESEWGTFLIIQMLAIVILFIIAVA